MLKSFIHVNDNLNGIHLNWSVKFITYHLNSIMNKHVITKWHLIIIVILNVLYFYVDIILQVHIRSCSTQICVIFQFTVSLHYSSISSEISMANLALTQSLLMYVRIWNQILKLFEEAVIKNKTRNQRYTVLVRIIA